MKLNQSLAILASVGILAACSSAPKSNEVGAAYVPTTLYQNMTCEQLITEAESVRRAIPALESTVDKHHSNQKGVEIVTWILFWPAAFALDKGEANSAQLAKAKGEIEAISLAMKSKRCGG